MFPAPLAKRLGLVPVVVTVTCLCSAANTGPITRLTIAKDADVVPIFDGVASGRFNVRMVALDAYKSNVFVTNTSSETLNVALPKAMVGVHVLPQFNNGFFGNGNNANGFFGNNQVGNSPQGANTSGLNAASNLAQSVGGQPQPVGVLGNGSGNPPFGFPSVPAEWSEKPHLDQYAGFAAVPAGKTIQFQLRTVCLNYGQPEPGPALPYHLTSVERFTSDPVLAELLECYGPRIDQQVMQAAAWHVANGLTWEQVAQLPNRRLVGTSAKLFAPREVQAARTWLQSIEQRAANRPATLTPRSPQVATSAP